MFPFMKQFAGSKSRCPGQCARTYGQHVSRSGGAMCTGVCECPVCGSVCVQRPMAGCWLVDTFPLFLSLLQNVDLQLPSVTFKSGSIGCLHTELATGRSGFLFLYSLQPILVYDCLFACCPHAKSFVSAVRTVAPPPPPPPTCCCFCDHHHHFAGDRSHAVGPQSQSAGVDAGCSSVLRSQRFSCPPYLRPPWPF